jgi:hypothetical protein
VIKNILFVFRAPKSKLTRLGMSLFYFYMSLVLLGCAGMLYGVITFIQKCMHIHSSLATSWWEVIALMGVSWLMVKVFLREGYGLLDMDNIQILPKTNPPEQEHASPHAHVPSNSSSNVILFKRKSTTRSLGE